ncbi:MAG: gamma-glutamylcyclotransferase [Nitrospinaceae bacterium]|nr:gamma-glutamylcyclotransferase [Nitrospinaceae bacterium]NIR56315.1 gamma-glutamylcyclotransferase [Nitrospinaceae bacterium]NIS86772.1 gamma-glutamylcyclotransferase [Nitrospinaceae bacterium]NIT83607.1 gamma-glutamylcyclotransferase [Nitrospinaceae bacterium]NIU45809.1 gamma-glutamylcyclotransferase [Nitrospinaceae bacterium]
MSNLIKWFAYDEMMNPEIFDKSGLKYEAAFSVTLSAYRLVFNKIPIDNFGVEGWGQANISPTTDNLGMMEGVLYEMEDSYLARLDEIYGYPEEYTRKKLRLTKHDFTFVDGIVYIAQVNRTRKGLIPTKEMLNKFKGCRKILTRLYLSKLLIRPALDVEKPA